MPALNAMEMIKEVVLYMKTFEEMYYLRGTQTGVIITVVWVHSRCCSCLVLNARMVVHFLKFSNNRLAFFRRCPFSIRVVILVGGSLVTKTVMSNFSVNGLSIFREYISERKYLGESTDVEEEH